MFNRILVVLLCAATIAQAAKPGRRGGAKSGKRPGASAFAGDPYPAVVTYDQGQGVAPLRAIEAEIRKAPASQYPAIEAKLLTILQSARATVPAKSFACRQLRLVGSAACVPVVASLLTDAKLSDMARYALQDLASANVNDALRAALGAAASDAVRIGLINTLGRRGDDRAVEPIAKFMNAPNPRLAAAAMQALGQIGGSEATALLGRAKGGGALSPAWTDAYLMCADKLVARAALADAGQIYKALFAETYPLPVRIAALRGLVVTDRELSIPLLVRLIEDGRQKPELKAAAGAFLVTPLATGPRISQELARHLSTAGPVAQVALINALAERGDETGAAVIAPLLGSPKAGVPLAAARALGVIGSPASVPGLLATATRGGDLGKAAEASLKGLRTPGINEALIAQLPGSKGKATVLLIQTLAARRCAAAAPGISKASKTNNAEVQRAAVAALGVLLDEKNFKQLVDHLIQTKGSSEAEASVRNACRRLQPVATVPPLLGALPGAAPELRCAVLRLLGTVGGTAAMDAVRAETGAADATVADVAVRVLADWKSAAAAPDLLVLARTSPTETHRVLAFRGYMRLLPERKATPVEMSGWLGEAMKVAPRADEKRLVIGALGEVKNRAALPVLATALADPALQADAGSAYLRVVDVIKGADKPGAIDGLKKFLELSKDQGQRARAGNMLRALQAS